MSRADNTLSRRLDALASAAELAQPYLPESELRPLRQVLEDASSRRKLSAEHTVVGFFGATGSGKTSLFNAVVGEDLGASSPRRPTTSSPLAAIWGVAGSDELLDWLNVADRRVRPGDFSRKSGPLILLDLPDFDSVEASNRAIAERLAGQVDVLVWVTDPEKYADAVIHEQFIRPHAGHAAVTLAVLNKADRLSTDEQRTVAANFAELLRADGLNNVRVLATSARTATGVTELRDAISSVAARNNAQQSRISADLDAIAANWSPQGKTTSAELPRAAKKQLDAHLAAAAGADALATVTAAAYRKRLQQRTGWLLTSWILRLRADPLRRLGLTEKRDELGVHRTSMPDIQATGKAKANRGVRNYALAASEGLPQAWATAVAARVEEIVDKLPAELDRAAGRTRLPAEPSRAWSVMTVIQWLALLTALVGVAWFLLAAFLPGALAPLTGDTIPEIEGWPIPTLLILGGLLLGLVLGLLTAVFGSAIGAGVRRRTRRALQREIAALSAEKIEAPLLDVRQDFANFTATMRSVRR